MKLRTAATATVLLLAGCAGGTGDGGSAASPPEQRTLTVYAAASLTEVFTELEPRFEEVHPGVDVVFNFGASSDLAQQIVNGGPADLFAAANTSTMKTVSDAGLIDGQPTVFATNVLQIVTPPGNPAGITSFADLARPDLQAAGDSVQGIEFPEAAQAVNDYPIAVIVDAPAADLARAFQELVTGADGRAVLGSAGFG